ncbi:MAG: ribosome-binding factor A [Acidimicrobiales bacterium]
MPRARPYPRTARVDRVVQEIVAEALETLGDDDDGRLRLVTVTGVSTDPDLRHATVWFSAPGEGAAEALEAQRVRLQAEIGRQTRLKRTPLLSFVPDPAVIKGWEVEGIIHELHEREAGRHDG